MVKGTFLLDAAYLKVCGLRLQRETTLEEKSLLHWYTNPVSRKVAPEGNYLMQRATKLTIRPV